MSGTSKPRSDRTLRTVYQAQELQVGFSWFGDRYEHRIAAMIEGCEIPIARSLEANAANHNRDLPTFQELSIESIGGIEVACLVGMSGKAYWSASVESIRGACGFVFDLSCKGAVAPQLTASYDLLRPWQVRRRGETWIELVEGWFCVVKVVPIDSVVGELSQSAGPLRISSPRQSMNRAKSLRLKHQWRLVREVEIEAMNVNRAE